MSELAKKHCHILRKAINETKLMVKELFTCVIEAGPDDLNEARANAKLAYRHLEDARMRLGKVIQAIDGGVSILDKVDEAGVVAGESAGNDFHNLECVKVGENTYVYQCVKCGITDAFEDTPCNQRKDTNKSVVVDGSKGTNEG